MSVNNIKLLLIIFTSMLLAAIAGCQRPTAQAQGYVEGQFSYISASYSGTLEKLFAQRGQSVQTGQQLFILDPQPELASQQEAQAKVDAAGQQKIQAANTLTYAQTVLQRREALFGQKTIPQEVLDTARNNYNTALTDFNAAVDNLTAAQAALKQSIWTQQQKTATAMRTAFVFDTYYLPGEIVPAGHPVLALLAPQDIKIIFFLPEEQLSQIKLNQKILFSCDQCNSNTSATISFISPQAEYTPPVIYSEETRAKLIYRIEAIPINPTQLHPGEPITIRLN